MHVGIWYGLTLAIERQFPHFCFLCLQALEEGPRAADQFAAVMSCLIVMVSALSNVQELLANTLLALADGLERSRNRNDSIASSNTTRVICCLYLCKGIGEHSGPRNLL